MLWHSQQAELSREHLARMIIPRVLVKLQQNAWLDHAYARAILRD